jgi:hypothetical protein
MGRSIKLMFTRGIRVGLGAAIVASAGCSGVRSMPHESPRGIREQQERSGAQPVPDLDDPIVRRRLVCSFASGSFGISPRALPGDDPYCQSVNR